MYQKQTYPFNEGNKFIYPENPEDVVQGYLEAVYLEIDSEIEEMITNKDVKNFKVLDYFDEESGFEYGLLLDFDKIVKNDDFLIIKATDIRTDKYLYFELTRVEGMWKISKISNTRIH